MPNFDRPQYRIADYVLIRPSLLTFSNRSLDSSVVSQIVRNFDPVKFGVLPVYKITLEKFILTDGNHRVCAAQKLQIPYVPCVFLTKVEYEWVKFSNRTCDIGVSFQNPPEIYD